MGTCLESEISETPNIEGRFGFVSSEMMNIEGGFGACISEIADITILRRYF